MRIRVTSMTGRFLSLSWPCKKTVKAYGPYELRLISAVTFKRATALARSNTYQNFFFKLSYEASISRELGFVRFPN